MIDGAPANDGGAAAGEAAAAEAAPGGEAAAAAAAAEGAGGAVPEWLSALPDDLKADPTLTRFPDVEKLARGAIDLKRLSASRVIVPGEGADDAQWNTFYDAIGRPADPAKYEIPVPEGADTKLAEAFRPVAHKLGLTPAQAKGLAEFNNESAAAELAAWSTRSQAEVDAVKAATPDYDRKIGAAKDLFKKLGGDSAIAQELDVKLGSGNLIKFFLGLADRAGEHGRIDGDAPLLDRASADPESELKQKMADPTWREKINNKDADALGEYNRLLSAARQKAQNRGKPS